MKKLILSIAAVAMIFATSCKKENINEPEVAREPEANEFCAEIANGSVQQNMPAVNGGMTTKTKFSGNSVIWENGDSIWVNEKYFYCTVVQGAQGVNNRAYFESKPKASYTKSVYHAFYSQTVTPGTGAAGTLLATQTYDPDHPTANLPMYAHSTNHWLTFHNICGVLRIIVPATCTTIKVTTDEANNGAFTIVSDENGGYKATLDPSASGKTIIMTRKTGKFAPNDTVYIAMPAGSYSKLKISLGGVEGSTNNFWDTGESNTTYNVQANKIHHVNLPFFIPGKFKVGANKYVRFTVGSLFYNRTTKKYGMELLQLDVLGTYSSTHVGHFYYDSDPDNATAATYPSGSSTNSSLFCDENHKISVFGYDGLYCLSETEWKYLLNLNGNNNLVQKDLIINSNRYVAVASVEYQSTHSTISAASVVKATKAGILLLPITGGYRMNSTNITDDSGSRFMTSTNSTTDQCMTVSYRFPPKSSTTELVTAAADKNVGRNIRLVKDVQ